MDLSEYCRDIETYLCRKNDGHLIRIVGPSFDLVSNWAAQGVPLKVALSGIDRYFERYYRKGPRRRPVKIDFCEADVLDVFDEWRRATGVTTVSNGHAASHEPVAAPAPKRRGVSLPEHLERVLVRLSSLRATGVLDEAADPILDRVSAELDRVREKSGGLRGDDRQATLARLADLDAELISLATASAGARLVAQIRAEAAGDLASFRTTMAATAFESAIERTAVKLLRDRLGLPTITFF
jgi:hypothetical protein